MDWPLHGAEGAKRVRGVLKGPLATLRWLSPFFLLYILFALICLLLPKCMSAHCANAAPEEGRDHLWDSVLSLSSDGSQARVISVLTSHLTSPAFGICRPVSTALALEPHCPTRVQACSALSPGRWTDGRVWSWGLHFYIAFTVWLGQLTYVYL